MYLRYIISGVICFAAFSVLIYVNQCPKIKLRYANILNIILMLIIYGTFYVINPNRFFPDAFVGVSILAAPSILSNNLWPIYLPKNQGYDYRSKSRK